ncbi:hypothetical protein [Methylobacterium radiotolerans]|uniref:hypothetical protein n=1 Tax=Methylobacterium radiotolerans TaxID=31998 RepID=UPI0033994A94
MTMLCCRACSGRGDRARHRGGGADPEAQGAHCPDDQELPDHAAELVGIVDEGPAQGLRVGAHRGGAAVHVGDGVVLLADLLDRRGELRAPAVDRLRHLVPDAHRDEQRPGRARQLRARLQHPRRLRGVPARERRIGPPGEAQGREGDVLGGEFGLVREDRVTDQERDLLVQPVLAGDAHLDELVAPLDQDAAGLGGAGQFEALGQDPVEVVLGPAPVAIRLQELRRPVRRPRLAVDPQDAAQPVAHGVELAQVGGEFVELDREDRAADARPVQLRGADRLAQLPEGGDDALIPLQLGILDGQDGDQLGIVLLLAPARDVGQRDQGVRPPGHVGDRGGRRALGEQERAHPRHLRVQIARDGRHERGLAARARETLETFELPGRGGGPLVEAALGLVPPRGAAADGVRPRPVHRRERLRRLRRHHGAGPGALGLVEQDPGAQRDGGRDEDRDRADHEDAARDPGPPEPAGHRASHRVPRPVTRAASRSVADSATTHSVILPSAR